MSKLILKGLLASLVLFSQIDGLQPQDILNDTANETKTESGMVVRKGTIYATILNIRQFDKLIKEEDSPEKTKEIEIIIQDIKSVIPALESVKMFELFSLEEWIAYTPGNEGRVLVGLLYLQKFPEEASVKIINALKDIFSESSKTLQQEILNTLKVIK